MADRVGVINRGRIMLVEETAALMRRFGKRRLALALHQPLPSIPPGLSNWSLALEDDGRRLVYDFDAKAEEPGISSLLRRLGELGIEFKDLDTSRSSLEDIFVSLVGQEQ
jgi:ABC-2 type transport system ATP-binding protein